MAAPNRDLFEPGKQARVNITFTDQIAGAMNARCLELGCTPKDYVKYCVMRDLDRQNPTAATAPSAAQAALTGETPCTNP
jgi:hypothetical protein